VRCVSTTHSRRSTSLPTDEVANPRDDAAVGPPAIVAPIWIVRLPTISTTVIRICSIIISRSRCSSPAHDPRASEVFTQLIAPREVEFLDYSGQLTNARLHWSVGNWDYPQETEMEVDGIAWGHEFSVSQVPYRGSDPLFLKGRLLSMRRFELPRRFRARIWGPRGSSVRFCFHLMRVGAMIIIPLGQQPGSRLQHYFVNTLSKEHLFMRHADILNREGTILLISDVQKKMIKPIYRKEAMINNIKTLVEFAGMIGLPVVLLECAPQTVRHHHRRDQEVAAPARADQAQQVQLLRQRRPDLRLEAMNTRTLVVVGMETHISISQTVLDALTRGFKVHVVLDATSSRHKIDWRMAIEKMRRAGAVVTTMEMVHARDDRAGRCAAFPEVPGIDHQRRPLSDRRPHLTPRCP